KTQNGITDIIKMRHLRFVAHNAVLELARVPHHHAVADDDVLAHVTATADMTLFANPSRSFYDGALFNNGAAADEDSIADERFSHQLPEHSRLQTKLQIARDLFERVPNETLIFEQLRVDGVLECYELGRREFLFKARGRHVG